jgi:hypothetical protein
MTLDAELLSECFYSVCIVRYADVIMLSGIMLNVTMHSVVKLVGIMLGIIMLNVTMYSVVKLVGIMLSVIMLGVVKVVLC